MPKIALLLAVCLLLCSCSALQEKTFETETESTTISEAAVETSSETSAETHTTSIAAEIETAAETTAEADIEYGEYVYSPPQEVLGTHFYCEDVEEKITLQNASNEDFDIFDIFNDPEVEKAMHKAWAENLPQEIVDDMIENPQFHKILHDVDKNDIKITSMSYMKYDFNSDGIEDYYVSADLDKRDEVEGLLYMQTFYDFCRVYITKENGFLPIKIPTFGDTQNSIHSILSTETNGVKDLLAFCNSNAPSLKYDGISSYGDFTEADERHTFLKDGILPGNILHINMKISVIDAPLGEYYTAIKFADNPYLKNNVLYTCYPDGTPRSYIKKPYEEWLPTDFNPSQEGYDFYIELNEDKIDEFKAERSVYRSLDLLEIKYIAVN